MEVPIKTRSTPTTLSFKGQATKLTTVKWSISVADKHYKSRQGAIEHAVKKLVDVLKANGHVS